MFLEDMPWAASGILIFSVLVLLLLAGIPIAFAMVVLGITGLLFTEGLDGTLNFVNTQVFHYASRYTFLAFPLFAILVEILTHTGLSSKLIDIAQKTMGRLPGGLAVVCVGASTIFGAVCGSTLVGTMVMTDTLLPECTKQNYDRSFIAGTLAAGGNLSALIPPSFLLIFWGIIAEISIGDLFMAGIVPGIIIATLFIIYIIIKAKRNPEMAPPPPRYKRREAAISILKGWDLVVIIFVLLYGIYFGVANLTEIAAVTTAFAVIITVAERRLNVSVLYAALRRAAEMVGSIIFILIGVGVFMLLLNDLRIPYEIASWVNDANMSPVLLVIVVQILFFVLGMFIDPMSLILICLPLFLPALKAADVDLLWLGIVVSISCMIANLTPPVGFNLFIVQGAGAPYGLKFTEVVRGSIPFILLMIIGMALVIAIPSLATWLPSTMN